MATSPLELLQGIQDFAIIRMDSSGHIIEWAAGSEKLFGYSPREALGRHIGLIFTASDVAAGAPQAEMQIAATQERAEDTRWHVKKSGACFFANGIMNPLRDAEGGLLGFVKVLRDNSAQKKLLDELDEKTLALNAEKRKIERKVEELNEERALRERFINTLTHDLRTPLTTAKMSAQLALRYRESSQKRERLLLKVIEAVERTDTMIGDLLDASLIKAGEALPLKFSHCDLAFVIEICLEEHRLQHGERFRLDHRGKCEGYWSQEGLRRVIDNLLNNAVKYGSADAPIEISLECVPDGAKFTVHNQGEELRPEEVQGLFKLFSRTKTAESSGKRGWGIGLTLVKGIVEAHKGRVWAESAAGRGTTFHVELPRDFRAARSK